MKSKFLFYFISIPVAILSIYGSCNKPPFYADYENVKGYVIGNEICNTDTTKDYWLIDLTYLPNAPRYGDTLVLNGITYTNAIKTKDLAERLKQKGMRVSIDFKTITPSKVVTIGCAATNPVTYNLKELFIIYQGEIR
ncbi:MAG: hypothetical protein JWQ96_1560 [Segetibacter sp.]|nr:hypothetical protein [Segetibacter sp.]